MKGDDVTTAKLDAREVKQFIAGEWSGASGGGTFEDLDPFTGDVVALVPAGGREDAVRAIQAGAGAVPAAAQGFPAPRHGIFLTACHRLQAAPHEGVSR